VSPFSVSVCILYEDYKDWHLYLAQNMYWLQELCPMEKLIIHKVINISRSGWYISFEGLVIRNDEIKGHISLCLYRPISPDIGRYGISVVIWVFEEKTQVRPQFLDTCSKRKLLNSKYGIREEMCLHFAVTDGNHV